MAREVNVKITKDGSKVEFDLMKFEGSSCKDFIRSIRKTLGEVEEERKKPEFYREARQSVKA